MQQLNFFQSTSTPQYSEFIHLSRYARWLEDKKRRETWEETVSRYFNFFSGRFKENKRAVDLLEECKISVLNLESMPSMRCLMTAGPALDISEVAGYNCSYAVIDHPRVFDEIMYVLLCGTGVGFSVEQHYVNQLPDVAESFHDSDTTIVVADSKIGWASSFRELISMLYAGKVPKFDFSRVRPAGARLKTFGGRASGPKPLADLFEFSVQLFKKAAGRKLSTIECHDLVCKIAEIVVVGGVRRSALISLSNLSDDRMRVSKSGQWWMDQKQRALANNSAVYTEKPNFEVFFSELQSLYSSKSGERGIFSRVAAKKTVAKNGRRDPNYEFGTNPCSEIILRAFQFCNLTEVVLRSGDSLEDVLRKIRVATILGTFQSTLTNFKYLRKIWRKNTEEERLLGVSLTGIMDHPVLNDLNHPEIKDWLKTMREYAIEVNKEISELLGINQSTAITCVKPSGTISQLVDSASGIHARFAPYYIRTVRADKKDPLAKLMVDLGFPYEVDVMNSENLVFSFPIKSPEQSKFVKDIDAVSQIKLWELYQEHWCEHKPSVTIYYTDDSFFKVADYCWNNFDKISGISFLPYSDHNYEQAPYQEITEDQFYALQEKMPKDFTWESLALYETEDGTKSSQTLACTANGCESVDLI